MADHKIRVGFVGVGFMGQMAHLRNYAVLDDCEVVALAELREDVGRKVAERYGVPKVYSEAAEMLAAEKLDCIVASQPFTRHGVLVPQLLEKGVPLFTEKPIAGSIETAEDIVEKVDKSGTFLMVGYHKRSDPAVMCAIEEIDRLLSSGELGSMRYVRLLMPAGNWVANGGIDAICGNPLSGQLPSDPPASDMSEEEYKAYLSFVNYYIHQVNLMRHLLREPYTVTYAEPSGVMLAGQSESGVACTIEMSPFQTTLDWQEQALVCFEHGWIKIDLPAPLSRNQPGRVSFFRDPGNGVIPQTSMPQLPWDHAMRQQARNFLIAVRDETPPLCGASEALEDLKVAREYMRLMGAK